MDSIRGAVSAIISNVRKRGDLALCEYARRFDQVRLRPSGLRVTSSELREAVRRVSPEFLQALKTCAQNVERFAKAEKRRLVTQWSERRGSVQVGQLVRPVDSAGLYIPGGRFPYPSTVLMTAIPARVAGVRHIVMTSPPKNLTPEVLAAAHLVGCDEVYRIGGAGAIAALAYGTRTVTKVDMIVGPGNQYVAEAKRQVFGDVGIDSLAGPSEVVIITDRHTPLEYLEADLQAQAEHDPEAQALLLSTDASLLRKLRGRLDPKIAKRVKVQRVRSISDAIDRANAIGPEHLELLYVGAAQTLGKVRHAGAIFLGSPTTAVLGDYVAGPSHVLPTHSSARFSSGLSVATFLKRSSVIGYSAQRSERRDWEAALQMAQTEGMEHHEHSLRARIQR